jgi:arylsulfatase A-like enzyme
MRCARRSGFHPSKSSDTLLPNPARIRTRATSFESHHTAANMCVAARGTMLTGLYGHLTGCMLAKAVAESSTLSGKFPTWGTMLRQQGYEITWWGKWHLGPEPERHPVDLRRMDSTAAPTPRRMANRSRAKKKTR